MKEIMTYPQFLTAVKSYSVPDIESFVNDASGYCQLFPEYTAYASRLSGVYIFSYPLGRYLYIDKTLARLANKSVPYILDRGLGPKEKLWHAPDQIIHNKNIFAKNLEAFRDIPVAGHAQHLIKCNYRIRQETGELRNIRQQSFFIRSAEDGTPLIVLGFVSDISDIRNDNRIVHSVCNSQGGELFAPDVYYARDEDRELRPREIEIIQLANDGLNSRKIAERLHITVKTVENHKQNIRELTNTKNIIESLNYARQHGYID